MNHATQPKPRRQDFTTDDEFGEAYALWMMRQPKVSRSTVVAAQPRAVPAAAAAAPKPLPPRWTARAEIERDTWNQHTKARFMRAKAGAEPNNK